MAQRGLLIGHSSLKTNQNTSYAYCTFIPKTAGVHFVRVGESTAVHRVTLSDLLTRLLNEFPGKRWVRGNRLYD